jgi:hypothetical protein
LFGLEIIERFPREKLLLNNNNLTVLPQGLLTQIFQSFTAAGKGAISLAENPLSCCRNLWLFRDRRVFKWLDDLDTTTCIFNDAPVKFEDVKYRKMRSDCARQRRRPGSRRTSTQQANNDEDD